MALEPVLLDAVFDHILGVVCSAARSMELSPKTYAEMNEEDRHQVLLMALNGHNRGQTTAEAFNVAGKTDLLVRHDCPTAAGDVYCRRKLRHPRGGAAPPHPPGGSD